MYREIAFMCINFKSTMTVNNFTTTKQLTLPEEQISANW